MTVCAHAHARRPVLALFGIAAMAAWSVANVTATWAQQSPEVATAIEWAKDALPASTPEIISAAAEEGELVLTLQQFGDDATIVEMIRAFNEHYPFIDVTYTLQTSSQFMKKFSAEVSANTGISDYLMLPSNLKESNNYIDAGAILEFVVSEDAKFPEHAKRSGLWYAWLRQHSVTVYRPDALTEEERQLIHTYAGLADPRFKGRLGINNVTTSVTSSGTYVLLQSAPELWEGLVANEPKVKPTSPALMDGLLSGEYDIALMSGFPTAVGTVKSGAPVEFVVTSPSPVLYSPGAISALAPHPNAAKLWQDWSMSKEGQDLWSTLTGTISSRDDVVRAWSQEQPWFFEDVTTHQAIDWDDFSVHQEEVVARFQADLQTE